MITKYEFLRLEQMRQLGRASRRRESACFSSCLTCRNPGESVHEGRYSADLDELTSSPLITFSSCQRKRNANELLLREGEEILSGLSPANLRLEYY